MFRCVGICLAKAILVPLAVLGCIALAVGMVAVAVAAIGYAVMGTHALYGVIFRFFGAYDSEVVAGCTFLACLFTLILGGATRSMEESAKKAGTPHPPLRIIGEWVLVLAVGIGLPLLIIGALFAVTFVIVGPIMGIHAFMSWAFGLVGVTNVVGLRWATAAGVIAVLCGIAAVEDTIEKCGKGTPAAA